jgi:hypothetical protein
MGGLLARRAPTHELEFTASEDHASLTGYELRVYHPVLGLVGTADLGKPTPVEGQIVLNITTAVAGFGLDPGTYQAVVVAVAAESESESLSTDLVVSA